MCQIILYNILCNAQSLGSLTLIKTKTVLLWETFTIITVLKLFFSILIYKNVICSCCLLQFLVPPLEIIIVC